MNHILQAAFGANTIIKTAPLYQWDYGQVIRFVGLNLPSHFEAHFSNNQTSGTAITVIGENNEAAIPDSLLQTGLEIWAWVYLHDEVTDGETEYTARIPVKARARRDGTEPTPEEQDAIATAIEALNEATEVLDDAIAHTETYRDQAEAYATQSESWAIGGTGTRQGEDTDNSKYYRDQAEATAQRVTEAVDYFVDTTVPQAIQSVGDEGTAQIALVDAEGTAQIGAVGDAGTAQIALVGAEGTRQVGIVSDEGATQKGNVAAEGSAQIGNVRAEGNTQIGLVQSEGASQIGNVSSAGSTQVGNVNSAGSTQVGLVQAEGATQVGLVEAEGEAQIDAVGDAGDAQIGLVEDKGTEQIGLVEAEGASQIAAIEAKGEEVLSEMIDKAPIITDTASGAIASFPDGADAPIKQLTVNIQPQQDLHGYENPWPAGGGKNKFDQDTVYASYKQTDGSFLMTGSNANTTKIYIPSNLVGQTLTFSAYLKVPSGSTITSLRVVAVVGGTTSRSSLTSASDYVREEISFTPESTDDYVAISYGSYSDQLLQTKDIQLEVGSTATSFAPYKNECPITGWTGAEVTRAEINICDEQFESGGISTTTGQNVSVDDNIRSKYYNPCVGGTTYYIKGAGETKYVYWYDSGKNFISYRARTSDFTMAAPDNACYFRLRFAGYGTTYNNDASVNYPSTDTDYHQSHVATYPITFPSEAGTVYGGTLTVNQDGTGTLVVDTTLFDLGDLTWAKDGAVFYASRNDRNQLVDFAICSDYGYYGNAIYATIKANAQNGQFGLSSNSAQKYIVVRNDSFTDAADAKTKLTGVKMCYPIATPVTYTLTAAEMTTLFGQNNWWSDTGDVSVNYRADTKLYIDKKLAALLAALS